jgi:hypothetical protein
MKTKNNWETTANRYVVYIDIMGFKDMVAKMSHNDVYELMKRIDGIKKHVENVEWIENKSGLVKTTTYSDSIILYSKDDSYDSFDFIVSTTAGLIDYLFIEGIPFKGAVAFGLMTLDTDKSIFFGQPLIDAYLLQEEIYFYGVVFHATVEKEILLTNKRWPSFTSTYLCNFKAGTAKHMTIYPMHANSKGKEYNERYLSLIKAVEQLRLKTSGYLRRYIDNTEQYLSSVCDTITKDYN